jgi:hypothetical protein
MKKRIGISQSNYLPWLGYFELIARCDEFLFLEGVQYTKNDWRNRNLIFMQNRPLWLTVPISRPFGLDTSIEKVLISDVTCFEKHIETIRHAYAKCSNREDLDLLTSIIISNPGATLSGTNIDLLKRLCEIFRVETILNVDSDSSEFTSKTHRILELCKRSNAEIYVSSTGALSYLDVNLLRENGIEVEWCDFSASRRIHNKIRGEELPLFSIVDTLMLLGKRDLVRQLHDI